MLLLGLLTPCKGIFGLKKQIVATLLHSSTDVLKLGLFIVGQQQGMRGVVDLGIVYAGLAGGDASNAGSASGATHATDGEGLFLE